MVFRRIITQHVDAYNCSSSEDDAASEDDEEDPETENEDANDEVTRNERGGDGTAHVGSAFTVNRRCSRPSS